MNVAMALYFIWKVLKSKIVLKMLGFLLSIVRVRFLSIFTKK